MDPDATYADFLDALRAGDTEVASHRLDDLAVWIARRGFAPTRLRILARPTTTELARLLRSAAVVLARAAQDLQPQDEGETP